MSTSEHQGQVKIWHLHPAGWENDPEEEHIPLSTLDYLPPCLWNNWVLFFRLDESKHDDMAILLRAGLEKTLAQARHLCGRIEKNQETNSHSFVKRRDSTVQFHVQDLTPHPFPSFDDLEASNFSTVAMGDLALWSVSPMTHGIKPEAHFDVRPAVAAFKANFVRGGLVLNMHSHHCANDVMGWSSFTHQLAENCLAIQRGTAAPPWDPACLNRERLMRPPVPETDKIDAPMPLPPWPGLKPVQPLLFHLPTSKAARLKDLASTANDADASSSWTSTFDAFSAFIWRTLTRLRVPTYGPDAAPEDKVVFMAPVNMRARLNNPPCPPRTQGNMLSLVRGPASLDWVLQGPLPELALFIRSLTKSATQEDLETKLDRVVAVRDKSRLNLRADSFSPLTLLLTDWRATDVTAADFGMASPTAFRHVSDNVTRCVVQVYPRRAAETPGSDEGFEFVITYEKELSTALIEDPEWSEFFEYRGVM